MFLDNDDKLLVYSKMEYFLYRVYPMIIKYPASEKYSLAQETKNCIFNILKNISLANKVKSKRFSYSQEADGHLQLLKVLINLAKQQKYISITIWEELDLDLSEINKLLKGYIKSS